MTTPDLGRAVAFYAGALGFAVEREFELGGEDFARCNGIRGAAARGSTLRLGDERIELVQFAGGGAPYPADSASPDLWFQHVAIVVSDMGAAHAHLSKHGVGWTPISEGGPQQLPPSSGGVTALKFRDPDGHPVELLCFPPGGGPTKWRGAAGSATPFLGIDHSAIAVADTARSAAFYTDLLGLSVGSRSVNRGVEQERLDAAFNAVVEVTPLLMPDENSPHVELLCYRVPPTGRPIPVTARPHDVAATVLLIETADLAAMVDRAMGEGVRFVSPGLQTDTDGRASAMLHDPDGHLLLLRG